MEKINLAQVPFRFLFIFSFLLFSFSFLFKARFPVIIMLTLQTLEGDGLSQVSPMKETAEQKYDLGEIFFVFVFVLPFLVSVVFVSCLFGRRDPEVIPSLVMNSPLEPLLFFVFVFGFGFFFCCCFLFFVSLAH